MNSFENWHSAFQDKKFVKEFLISLFLLIFIVISFSYFSLIIEARRGVQLNDPFLALLPARDLTVFIFLLMYSSVATGICLLINEPRRMNIAIVSFSLLIILRMTMMYLVPLDPPAGTIPMADPFIGIFTGGKILTRDLFFSGHTATIFLLYLIVPKWKKLFLLLTFAMASAVLLQKIHYTIDVVAAPFMAYVAYQWGKKIFQKSITNIEP